MGGRDRRRPDRSRLHALRRWLTIGPSSVRARARAARCPREEAILIADEDRVLEVLDEEECRRLLEKSSTGRLVFTDGALPAVLPVSHALHDGHVLVAARRDSPLTGALRGSVVAFQVDAWAGEDRTGWSVTVVGPSRVITSPAEVQRLDDLQLSHRAPSPDRCYVAVRMDLLRGWRMSPSAGAGTAERPVPDGP